MTSNQLTFKLPSFKASFNLEFFHKIKISNNCQMFNHPESKKLFCLISVSGSGRSTLLSKIEQRLGSDKSAIIKRSTTRQSRDNQEKLNFYSPADFLQKIKQQEFLYYLKYKANHQYYGLEYTELTNTFSQNKSYYLFEDTPSSTFLKKFFPESTIIFYLNSTENIQKNLEKREKNTPEKNKRFQQSIDELEVFHQNINSLYNSGIIHSIVNNNQTLNKCLQIIVHGQRINDFIF